MIKGNAMKRTVMFTIAISAGMVAWQFARSQDNAGGVASTQPAAATTQASPEQYKAAAYGIGFQLGSELKRGGMTIDPNTVADGIRDGLAGGESKVKESDIRDAMRAIQKEMTERVTAKARAEGDAFRAENGKKANVITTASGLQIEITKEGTGATPTAADTIRVHYTGTLIDGTKFDSSIDRNEPAEFPLANVIPGWTEGFQKLKVGSKARLVIPPAIGYGARGFPPDIPPNATLIFDVELLDIVKKGDPANNRGG
jgi:FKBP-type peptidyl-prolyl cis-trans isomerase